jgi:hypothetical protein
MAFTTLSIRDDIALRLKKAKGPGESYSDTLARLLDDQPAKTGGEWLDSLGPLEGRGIFSPEARARLKRDQGASRPSPRKRRAAP